ncbi:MAG: peptidase C1 [Bacteroidetes bacterium]|nr:MAG: peptidase C1 [Bacteroidota bacterium]
MSKPPAGAKKYGSKRFADKKLPSKVDLRKQMTAIEVQGGTNSCTANAVAGAYEYLVKKHLGEEIDVSRLFIYYNARSLEETEEIEDNGSFIYLAIEGLKSYGACSEETWEFDEDMVNEEPSEEAYEEAASFLVEETEHIPIELDAWKSALAEGYPIIFGISTFNSFDSHKKPGLVPNPTKNEAEREEHGGHAMLCVGYSDKDEVFIVRNSWGEDWGDNGYCYISYKYMLNPDYNDGDCWIVKRIEEGALDEGTWSDDEESVLGDYESELANMSDEDYEAMLDDMGEYPLEYRLAIIFIHAAQAEGDLAKAERQEMLAYMRNTFEALGSEYDAKEVLKYVLDNNSEDQELLEESVALLGQYLSAEMLATIVHDLEQVIGIDELADEESEFLDYLTSEWQIEEDEDEEEDE